MTRAMLRLAPWLILGPVTGPLVAGAVSCVRAKRYAMAGWYVAGIVEFWLIGPMWLAWALSFIQAHVR